jgi:hypothetical protein
MIALCEYDYPNKIDSRTIMDNQSPQSSATREQFIVRFPEGLRAKVKAVAAANRRSMNAELLLLIERGLAASGEQGDVRAA